MKTSADHGGGGHTPGRGRRPRSRPGGIAAVLPAATVAALVITGAVVIAGDGERDRSRSTAALGQDLAARNAGHQVLGDERTPGVPTVQRIRHDDVVFTVTVAPARPGPNLVRVDRAPLDGRHEHDVRRPVRVGTGEGDLVRARPRPGADGLWATVDLPAGTGTVLVTHGPRHRVPFAVETGTGPSHPDVAAWTGADGPECLTAATGAVLAGGTTPDSCPADGLDPADATALRSVVDTLDTRGVRQLAVEHDESARSRAAAGVVRRAAARAGIQTVSPAVEPGGRSALLVVSGWAESATSLARITALPLRDQPVRTDGTWLAPWLLTPAVVDSTLGAVLPLGFSIRDAGTREFSQTLAKVLPGQAPTSSAYRAWRTVRGAGSDPYRLFAASRAAYMPAERGHASHGTTVAWFPGGTITPIGTPLATPSG